MKKNNYYNKVLHFIRCIFTRYIFTLLTIIILFSFIKNLTEINKKIFN